MAYVPTVWATGDVITAEKLNNIENGIVGIEVLEVAITITFSYDIPGVPVITAVTCSNTCQEIADAWNAKKDIVIKVRHAYMSEDEYILASFLSCYYDDFEETQSWIVDFSFDLEAVIHFNVSLRDDNNVAVLHLQDLVESIIVLEPVNNQLPIAAAQLEAYARNNTIKIITSGAVASYNVLTSYNISGSNHTFTFGNETYIATSGAGYPEKQS